MHSPRRRARPLAWPERNPRVDKAEGQCSEHGLGRGRPRFSERPHSPVKGPHDSFSCSIPSSRAPLRESSVLPTPGDSARGDDS